MEYPDYGEASEGYRILASLPVIATDAKLCAADDTILCFTSEDDGSGGDVVRVWKYNPDSDAWSTVKTPDGAIKLLYGITYETAVAGVILLILMQEKVSIELTGSGLMNTAGC